MAYDEVLAARIRDLLSNEHHIEEKKMFGGLAFLIRGNMAIAASGQGGAMVRVNPDDSDRLVKTSRAEHLVMRGKEMSGWLRVSSENVATKRQLEKWVRLSVRYASSLPDKTESKRRR